ncbi:UDP-N-acetylmuramoyl-L-alanyl-D-glutamate-2,6-diaminopimelate ligase [Candidatus Phycosocius bacilliformis]|uniref:UDP-N-acetylmuramoyl-L-alanyl-D-glutamate--2,6-diaminopimelate ligase n=1 Tax=Candidatus Phycosocius bacilliformis TaxID=1445552 RepID=A0A2P2ECB2_9PROT|nr:UDP-N-acetylmuramoyl-L-alanyl-D-glutamate--2,6-diaminopimelate ligase [Candidatus Phycosocius bacilliformis]GBF58674.1 UDP-N-acetylmuramoyl-L-alanyl-D-glutamate-2,6-diaminopimelate ligase [Candidatus Phycosocius bacilliformis]
MKLADLLDLGSGHPDANLSISGLSSDSRKTKPGDLFAALTGSQSDGRAYVDQAVAAGAVAVLAEPGLPPCGVPVIEVPHARAALSRAASRFYPRQPDCVVAITGTNGKSSTVDFLRQIWAQAGRSAASVGTLGAIGPKGRIDLGFTTPDPISLHATLQNLADEGITHVAMESSSHALDQRRMHGVRLAAAGFSNLTQDHLDYHGTMEEYRRAKLRLFNDLLATGQPAIVNADAAEAPAFEQAAKDRGLDLKLVGWRGDFLKIEELWPKPASQRVDLRFAGKTYPVEIPLIGEFQALNAVMAAGFALSLGEDPAKVFAGLAGLKTVKGRMEHIGSTEDGAHVFVDYAHTPDGLDVLLRAARPHAPGRVVLVFGCGGDRDKGKRPQMGALAAKYADVVIVTDDNPRTEDAAQIRRDVLAGCPNAREIGDRGEAIAHAVGLLSKGDCLLIAGKGHETGQLVMGQVLPFSDQESAAAALLARGGSLD